MIQGTIDQIAGVICSTSWTWWCHQMETFSALLALRAGNSLTTSELPAQRPVTRSFDVLYALRLNKRLSKQYWGWWFETPSRSLWRHGNGSKDIILNFLNGFDDAVSPYPKRDSIKVAEKNRARFYLPSWSPSPLKFFLQVTWPFSIFTPSDLEAKSLGKIPSDFGCWFGYILGRSNIVICILYPFKSIYVTLYDHGWPSTQPGTCTQPCPILLTQPCPHCSHSRAPGEQWALLCVFTLQGCVQAARLCRGSPVMICFITYLIKAVRILFIDELGVRQHRGHCGLRWCCIQWRHYSVDAWRHNSVDADAWRRQQRIARKQ